MKSLLSSMSGEHSLRTVSNLPGTVSTNSIIINNTDFFYTAFTKKAQNARHTI